MKRIDKYNFAISLLKQNNIIPMDRLLRMNCKGDIVIHSKQLANCLIIPPQATKKTIKNMIDKQIAISKNIIKEIKQ